MRGSRVRRVGGIGGAGVERGSPLNEREGFSGLSVVEKHPQWRGILD